MKPKSMESFEMLGVYLCFLCFLSMSSTLEMITPTQPLRDSKNENETLVSTNGTFEAGFFSPEIDSLRRYLGIWYKNISPRTVVWVANKENPLLDHSGVLKIFYGDVYITDGTGAIIWSPNNTAYDSVAMELLESGNMVAKDVNNKILWQSFDYPDDTLLPGMKLGMDLRTGHQRALTSWRSYNDPAPGEFSFRVHTGGLPQIVITKGSSDDIANRAAVYRPGSWNGLSLNGGVAGERIYPLIKSLFVMNKDEISYEIQALDSSTLLRSRLLPDGHLIRFIWLDGYKRWDTVYAASFDECERYDMCGANSICIGSGAHQHCECLGGFQTYFSESTCYRTTPPDCNQGDSFQKYEGVKLPDTSSSWYSDTISVDECQKLCLTNCSCSAYSHLNTSANGTACVYWLHDIVDVRTLPENGHYFYLRIAPSKFQGHAFNMQKRDQAFDRRKIGGIVVGGTIFIIVIVVFGFIFFLKRNKLKQSETNYWTDKNKKNDIDLPMFDFLSISNATNNFSESNKLGQGGFGPVYKGILSDGQEIAVKKLSKTSRQGLDEFKNEVMLITKLQHCNLVKLLGCSIQQDEKILIYEFMPNRSLDYFIFDSTRSSLIGWAKRFEIVDGIARGLLYLHQDSRLKIIHRDLKTGNVLLDSNMKSKISDFGMARTFSPDQDEANKNKVMGTYGYMSPEYAVHGSFSIKSDIFSFGVIVLEIISGRKNRGFRDPHNELNLLGHAWRLWIEKRPMELMDGSVNSQVELSKMLRYIHIGLLCVQHRSEDRPTMSSVVLMLNSENLLPEPSQPGFYPGTNKLTMTDSSPRNYDVYSLNKISETLFEAR
ncbi:G-type lectin S-receptor-like serine/threonine-protein kinase At4g27290 isoform X2 [Vigna unguiculata]|uniref:G-type lectin S-receptor-like serine/threonine-protein kinase At4g27290 isoform X2 n=1 Tax=Vigna unguiculata TaxID=3917 RepID=UPI001016F529|nr:G-type lectin S-receptor-like serine/threonine-protein kinase At4g27290 isoform X2 [Vigna unguiculata]